MQKSVLSAKYFHDKAAAFEFIKVRLWPNGPVSPHSGEIELGVDETGIIFDGALGRILSKRPLGEKT